MFLFILALTQLQLLKQIPALSIFAKIQNFYLNLRVQTSLCFVCFSVYSLQT